MNSLEHTFAETGAKVNLLLNQLEEEGHHPETVLSGAMTALLTRLIVRSPDNLSLLTELSHAMKKATILVAVMEAEDEAIH